MENEIKPNKAAALAPFAVALAEAMTARTVWLGKVKQARWKSRTITHDEYAATYGAYVKSKHKVREAVAEYQRAQNEYRNGNKPELNAEWRSWLAMIGFDF